MAGDFAISQRFTQADYTTLTAAGLRVDILVDLSHNANTTTTQHPSGQSIIAKAVELDIQIGVGMCDRNKFAKLAATSISSATFAIYGGIRDRGGFDTLTKRTVKVEASQYDASFVNATNGTLIAPLACANALNAAAFMLLPAGQRQSMGMYLWTPPNTYSYHGQQETQPRTAP